MKYIIHIPEGRGEQYERFSYPAGELQVRLTEAQIERLAQVDSVAVVARLQNLPDGEMELALLTSALRGIVKRDVTAELILPYLPYSRADRRFVPGDCFGLGVFAQFVNSLQYHEVKTLDVHSERSTAHIVSLADVKPASLIAQAISSLPETKGAVAIILPDEGAARYRLPGAAKCSKVRDAETGKLSGFDVPIDKLRGFGQALIVDDICDGGGTFLGIAEKIPSYIDLYLYVSHGIFSKGTAELNKRFRGIFSSDSFAQPFEGVTRFPCLPLLMGER